MLHQVLGQLGHKNTALHVTYQQTGIRSVTIISRLTDITETDRHPHHVISSRKQ